MKTEKHPMPALTEQGREDAIKHCKSVIKGIERWIKFNKRIGNPDTYDIMQLQCLQIALAALTTEPVVGWCASQEPYLLYTAPPVPPVPALKLPDEKTNHIVDDVLFAGMSGRKRGFNECLAEVKRLNGVKE